MSVGCCQLRSGVVWNADDCRAAESEIVALKAEVATQRERAATFKADWLRAAAGSIAGEVEVDRLLALARQRAEEAAGERQQRVAAETRAARVEAVAAAALDLVDCLSWLGGPAHLRPAEAIRFGALKAALVAAETP